MKNQSLLKSSLIFEFRPGDELEEVEDKYVYHYTSPEAFLSIIDKASVRFSDIRYMNDKSESIFIVKRLIEFAEKKKNTYPLFCEALNELLKNNSFSAIKNLTVGQIQYNAFPGLKMEKQRNFIFCTSNSADSLNMWNYYASGGKYTGYNIGLSVRDFLKSFYTAQEEYMDNYIIYHGNVIYKSKKQFDAIEELAMKIENGLNYGNAKQRTYSRAISIRNFIELKGPFFKDESFSSENEYRFLLSIAEKRIPHNTDEAKKFNGTNNKKIYEDFYIRNGILVPFLSIAIPQNSIGRITVSPMTEYEIAKSSIKEKLQSKGIKGSNNTEVPIYKSQIPIRY